MGSDKGDVRGVEIWELIREEYKRDVSLSGGWMLEKACGEEKRGKKRYRMKVMNAPKQGD